jgi:hypothetical protein
MANKYQRKVNRSVRLFNESFKKDIAPYNEYRLHQVKKDGRERWESGWLLEMSRNGEALEQKWFDYHDIVGLGRKQAVGRLFFWWVNDVIIRTKGE